jgi:putative DNA primase/helicase
VGEPEGGLSDFVAFARSHGLDIDYAETDNRWHRCRTEDKPRKKNGAYLFDGERGVVINFATMSSGAVWRSGVRAGYIDRAAIRAQRMISDAQIRAKQTEARALADDMIKRAKADAHPYLIAKGFPQEKGLVLDSELLIPMREFGSYRTLNSLQRISADGTKLFLPGGKAKGSVFFIGPMVARERWLVEGYATGLSVRAALQDLHRVAQVVVCFSAGNLAYIGRLTKNGRTPSFAVADNDESGAGEKAAQDTGLPWVMPPAVGTDANDMHQRDGLRALANLIRDPVRARAASAA